MVRFTRIALQIVAYGAFAVALAQLSALPSYQYASADAAILTLSLSHAANRVEPCVRRTPQEIAALPPNMRQAEKCERERLPLFVELDVDGERLIQIEAPPSGLWGDGPASIYEKRTITPGPHRISARLRDSARTTGWDYAYEDDVVLEAGNYFTVTFRAETGDFNFR